MRDENIRRLDLPSTASPKIFWPMLLASRSSFTLLVMRVVSNSWVRAATSYRLGVRWGRGGRRGGLAPRPGRR